MTTLHLLCPRSTTCAAEPLPWLIADSDSQLRAAETGECPSAFLLKKFDAERNGTLAGDEIPAMLKKRLRQVDGDCDGKISSAELDRLPERAIARVSESSDNLKPVSKGSGGYTPGKKGVEGESYAPPAREEFDPEILKKGDSAPDFTLEHYDKKGELAFDGSKGPKGFQPDKLNSWLENNL